MALVEAKSFDTSLRDILEFVVANGQTIFPGAMVGVPLAGTDGGRLVSWTAADDDVFMGFSVAGATIVGDPAESFRCPVNVAGVILEDVQEAVTDNPAKVGSHIWFTDDGPVMTFVNPDPVGNLKPPVGVVVGYRGPHPSSGGRYDVMLLTPGEFKAMREGKKANYTEP